jgi:hypothetical protein
MAGVLGRERHAAKDIAVLRCLADGVPSDGIFDAVIAFLASQFILDR